MNNDFIFGIVFLTGIIIWCLAVIGSLWFMYEKITGWFKK